MLLSFVFVPLILSYLTSYKYGIWLTINSVVSWFSMMDVGLSGGLRLKLQNALPQKDWLTARKYVSSTYNLLALISLACILVFVSIVLFCNVNYASFFKVEDVYNSEIRIVLIMTISCFFLRFILQPISVVLAADQLDFIQSIILLIEQILNLIGILIISNYTEESLLYASAVFSFAPLLNLSIFSLCLYKKKYKHIRPQLFKVHKECISSLFGIGIDVFITSISMIFIMQFNNILIVEYYSPNEVTIYNILIKLFGALSSFYILLISPLWSAFGNAFSNNDFEWVIRVFRKVSRLFVMFVSAYIVLLFFAPMILKIWAGLHVDDYFLLSCCCFLFVIQNIESTYAYLFNGTGQIKYVKLQRNMMIYGAFVNIPLVVLLAGIWEWGLFSVFVANIIAVFPRVLIYSYQGKKLLACMSCDR